jgi:hypothetical protein
MSAHERQAIVSLISTIVLGAFFLGYVLPRYPAGNPYAPEVFHFWGLAVVILVPVSIVSNITVSIVYTIATQENVSPFADERDRFIQLRSLRIALYAFTENWPESSCF